MKKKNSSHVLRAFYVTGTVLCTAHMLTDLSQQQGEVGALLPPFPDVEPNY